MKKHPKQFPIFLLFPLRTTQLDCPNDWAFLQEVMFLEPIFSPLIDVAHDIVSVGSLDLLGCLEASEAPPSDLYINLNLPPAG